MHLTNIKAFARLLVISMLMMAGPVTAQESLTVNNAITLQSTQSAVTAKEITVKCTTANLNVREGPGTNTRIIKTLVKGTPVNVISEGNGWSKLENGYYVCSTYLKSIYTWESASVDESDYLTKVRKTSPKTIRVLNFDEATTLNKTKHIVDYMISENGKHYYTVDESAEEGAIVANLAVGDIISIDGSLIQIDGEKSANYKKNTNAIKIWESIGFSTCIQTCVYPYGGAIVIKYGHVVQPQG